jgi:hypothetical protein
MQRVATPVPEPARDIALEQRTDQHIRHTLNPNPPTTSDAPFGTSPPASTAVATTLSIAFHAASRQCGPAGRFSERQ